MFVIHMLFFFSLIFSKFRLLSSIFCAFGGFPGSLVVRNLPANAGDMGSNPGLERSHLPQSDAACVLQLLSRCSKKPVLLKEVPPLATTRESTHTAVKIQHSQK